MKNKLLVSACAMALLASVFTSCKEKTDFDAIVDGVSTQTLKGYFSGAAAADDAVVMSVLQYNFADDGTVERTVMSLGDGVYKAPETTKFSSWSFGEFVNNNVARKIKLNPANGGDPMEVEFYLGGIMEEGQPMALDINDKVKDIVPTQDALTGKKWFGNDTTYYKKDTTVNIMKYDTVYTYKPKKDPETGKTMKDDEGHVIYEQTIKSVDSTLVPTKMKVNIAPKTVDIRSLELYRDASTLANVGKWKVIAKTFTLKGTESIIETDVEDEYEFKWCFNSFASAAAFQIKARKANGKDELIDVKYDAKIPAITVDKQVLKVEE